MNLIDKYKVWRDSPNRKPITLKNIFYFFQAYYRKWFAPIIPRYITEQYSYRLKIANKECLEKGRCVDCGCAVPDKFQDDDKCICYPAMMNKTEWNKFKKNNYLIL